MDGGGFDGYKNTVDNLSKSKVILMCGPAGSGKISLIMQNIDIVLDYSFWSREMRNQCMTGYLLGCVFRITCSIELVAHR